MRSNKIQIKLTGVEVCMLIVIINMTTDHYNQYSRKSALYDLLVEHMYELSDRLFGRYHDTYHRKKVYKINLSSLEAKAMFLWITGENGPYAVLSSGNIHISNVEEIGIEAVLCKVIAAIDRAAKNPKPNHPTYD